MGSDLSLYALAWYFLIYSGIGWIVEVCYQAVTKANIVNRGFLNGPVCPVYGAGAICLLLLLYGLDMGAVEEINPLVVFLSGTLITTVIELAAGWILDRLFHTRWWDYSQKPFNLHGYICLEFSLIWGFSVTFAARIIHPLVSRLSVGLIPERYGWPILGVLYLAYFADLVVTVAILRGLNKRLEELDRIRKQMRVLSDRMSVQIGENALETTQKLQEAKVQHALGKAELRAELEVTRKEAQERLQELRARSEQLSQGLVSSRHLGAGRILNAFPSMRHEKYHEALDEVKTRLRQTGRGKI